VGYEGLIRATDASGKIVRPAELIAQAPQGVARVLLDRQCRSVHVRNFMRFGDSHSWLFLNLDPYVAIETRRFGSFFSRMLEETGFPPHRVAVELIESPLEEEERLVTAIEYYREIGCLVVIDDFGAGYSNFDRIWRLKPDIVKIDREMTRRVAVEPLARRMLAGIVSILHEAGALVCVEGIETEAEALCATEADADLMQGNYFAPPAERLPETNTWDGMFRRLSAGFRADVTEFRGQRRARLEPYVAAMADAVLALSAGMDRSDAVRALLDLDYTQRCYLIAGDGSQIGASVDAVRSVSSRDPRLEPMRPTTGTNWQTKPFFRRAIEAPGKIQITRPYLSATGPKLCITLSFALPLNGAYHVLCADLDFAALTGGGLPHAPVANP
jgi:EAL domain-containing protein (putative c-di-GMP-specific phosphodiesterase class I)